MFNSFSGWTWIGLRDDCQESDFRWVNNAPLYYNLWKGSQPGGGNSQNCVDISADTNLDVYICNTPENHLCSTIGKQLFIRKYYKRVQYHDSVAKGVQKMHNEEITTSVHR